MNLHVCFHMLRVKWTVIDAPAVTERPENELNTQKTRKNMEDHSGDVTITRGCFPMI